MLPELVHPIFYRSGRLSDELRSHICPLGMSTSSNHPLSFILFTERVEGLLASIEDCNTLKVMLCRVTLADKGRCRS